MSSNRLVRSSQKAKRNDEGITRIPKTFVFDQNLPKEDYLKYINPENIIPESVEIATQVFSSYRKAIGSANIDRLAKADQLPANQKSKSIFPVIEPEKTNPPKDFNVSTNQILSGDSSIIKNPEEMKYSTFKKAAEKSKANEHMQDSIVESKANMLKDLTSLSINQDAKNTDLDRVTSPAFKLSTTIKFNEPDQDQTKGLNTTKNIEPANNNKEKDAKAIKNSNSNKTVLPKKKVEEDYQISELDNTKEIVRKTDLAVRALAKRGEKVKRDMKNFEENIKASLRENESAPVNSIRAMSLVKDFVFNEEEFNKLLEEEEAEEERANPPKRYTPGPKFEAEKKKENFKHVESRIKSLQASTFHKSHFNMHKKEMRKSESINITKEDKKAVNEALRNLLMEKEAELRKQSKSELRSHEMTGIFNEEKNMFRITSMNNVKLIKEKEKIKAKLLRDLRQTKYKERENNMMPISTCRTRSIASDRSPRLENQLFRESNTANMMESAAKEDSKSIFFGKIKDLLTKPIKDNSGNKSSDYNTHMRRVDSLKKYYNRYETQHVNTMSYHNL